MSTCSAAYCTCAPSQARLHAAAEARADGLAADLMAARHECGDLTARLGAATSEADRLRQELAEKSTQVEEVQVAKVGAVHRASCASSGGGRPCRRSHRLTPPEQC